MIDKINEIKMLEMDLSKGFHNIEIDFNENSRIKEIIESEIPDRIISFDFFDSDVYSVKGSVGKEDGQLFHGL